MCDDRARGQQIVLGGEQVWSCQAPELVGSWLGPRVSGGEEDPDLGTVGSRSRIHVCVCSGVPGVVFGLGVCLFLFVSMRLSLEPARW